MRSGFALALLALGASQLAAAAGTTKINGVTYADKGTVVPPVSMKDALPPEQSLRLKKVFLFPSIDDLSGALAPKLDEKLVDLFSHNTRFELVRDPQVVKALSPDEASYYKAALNQDVHKEAAKVTGADTTVLLRTRNVGPDTRMTLEFRDARGTLLFAEEGSVLGSAKMTERWDLIEKLYRGVLSRLPFEGTITGRTAATLTVDLGIGSMRLGEEIEIARIVSVQRHPLLGTVVGTDYVRTGRAKVTSVDRVLSFATVIEEFAGEKISPGQKVLRAQANVVHRGEPGVVEEKNEPDVTRHHGRANEDETPLDEKDKLKGDFDNVKARYGALGGDLYYGSISHSQTLNGIPADYSGSGVGGDLEGELWITKNWIFSGEYGFHTATLSTADGIQGGSTTWNNIGAYGGFRIFPEGVAEGVVLTGSVGYNVMQFQLPVNTSLSLSPKKFTGIVIKADGDVHFLQNQKITVGFSIEPFTSVTDTIAPLGTATGGSVIGVHLGWNRQLVDKLWLRIGMKYVVANGSYGDTSTSSLTDKRFAIGPG
ncbi:MAG: hypothetical protein ACXWSD_18525, partial [Bdellovibrionota bacterium]